MKKNHHKLKGVTLIEMIVALSLSVIIITALYYVFITSYQNYKQNSTKAEINQNARIALERISRDMRQTSSIDTDLPPLGANPETNPPSNNIEFVDGHDTNKIQYIKYLLTGNQLHRQVIHYAFSSDTGTWVAKTAKDGDNNSPPPTIDEDTVKADKVASLKFYGLGPIYIEIKTTDNNQSQTYQTQVYGRNL